MNRGQSGRPSGTDGSDFSYRMVVDNRYTKVAKAKSALYPILLTQGFLQLLGLVFLVPPVFKGSNLDTLAISSAGFGFVALLVGEFGRRRSRASLLTIYIVGFSAVVLLSLYGAFTQPHYAVFGNLRNSIDLGTHKIELAESVLLIFRLAVQVYALRIVVTLIHNMAPPKKAS